MVHRFLRRLLLLHRRGRVHQRTYRGHQGYGYKGGFDCGGNDCYNSYWNTITGNSNGNWSCSYTYSWRKSLGFQYQAWCGSGIYGEK